MSSYLDSDFRSTPSGTLSDTIEEQDKLVESLEKLDPEYVQNLEQQNAEILGEEAEDQVGEEAEDQGSEVQYDAPVNPFDPSQPQQNTPFTGDEASLGGDQVDSGVQPDYAKPETQVFPTEGLGITEPPADKPTFPTDDLGLDTPQTKSGIEKSPWDVQFLDRDGRPFPEIQVERLNLKANGGVVSENERRIWTKVYDKSQIYELDEVIVELNKDPQLVPLYDHDGDGVVTYKDLLPTIENIDEFKAQTKANIDAYRESLKGSGAGFNISGPEKATAQMVQSPFEGINSGYQYFTDRDHALRVLQPDKDISWLNPKNWAERGPQYWPGQTFDQDFMVSMDDFAKGTMAGVLRMTSDAISSGERFNDYRQGYMKKVDGQLTDTRTGDPYQTSSDKQFLDKYKYQAQNIRRTGASKFGEGVGYHFYPVLGGLLGSMALGPQVAIPLAATRLQATRIGLMNFLKFNPAGAPGLSYAGLGAFGKSIPGAVASAYKVNVKYTTLGNAMMDRSAHGMSMDKDDMILFEGNLQQMPWFQDLAAKNPSFNIAGRSIALGDVVNDPLVNQTLNVIGVWNEEAGYELLFGALASVFPISIWGGGKAIKGTKKAWSLKDKAFINSYDAFKNSKAMFDKRNLRLKSRFEAGKSQLNRSLEGSDSPWVSPNATPDQIQSTFGGYKNNNLKDRSQGTAATPTNTPYDVTIAADRNDLTKAIQPSGSTEYPFSPLQTKQMAKNGVSLENVTDLSKAINDDPRYQMALKGMKAENRTLGNLHDLVLKRTQEVLGRDAASVSSKEFWGPMFRDIPMSTGSFDDLPAVQAWSMQNVIAADNINQAVFSRLRDVAIGASEIKKASDIFSIDGPWSQLADNLVIGLANVKRSRYLYNLMGETLAGGDGLTKEALQELTERVTKRTKQLERESRDGISMMMEMLQNRNTNELADGILEVFRMSDDIHNWTDFDGWMRAKISGGEFKGKVNNGVLIGQLQEVMVNSILSGPKTPVRAIMGTGINAYYNALNQAAGATIRAPFTDNVLQRRVAYAKMKGMVELIPESWQVFNRNMKGYWSGDIKKIKNRYMQKVTASDEQWELYKTWTESNGTDADKAAMRMAEIGRTLNNNKFLSWSPRVLAAGDDTFKWLLARVRSKEKGLREIVEKYGDETVEITPQMMKDAEDSHFNNFLDADGNIDISGDSYLNKQFKEITLTEELQGWSASLDKTFNQMPLIKPFYLFARTGINGLRLSFKNTPLVGLLMDESRAILRHSGDDFTSLAKYGIDNAEDLANAKDLLLGRQAVGSAVVMTVAHKYLNGEMTGNGPADRQLKQQWINSGSWKQNHIYFGDVGFDYTSLEPFNIIFSAIADIGDNMELMGEEWAMNRLQAVAYVVGRGMTGKTYLSGLDQLMQMVQMKPWAWNKGMGTILNNSVPMAGMRNELGKFLNPHMKELNSSMWASIRNRNQSTEFLSPLSGNQSLKPKGDILDGSYINDHNFVHRAFNAVSPVQISLRKNSPGRKLLLESNYDMRSTTYSYNGYDLSKSAEARSLFQTAIGTADVRVGWHTFKNPEEALNHLAKQPNVIESLAKMNRDKNDATQAILNPSTDYNHNILIDNVFKDARSKAWASIQDHPVIKRLMAEQDALKTRREKSRVETSPLYKLGNP